MSYQDSDNTIDYLDGRVEDLEERVVALEAALRDRVKAAADMDKRRRVRIAELEAELVALVKGGAR